MSNEHYELKKISLYTYMENRISFYKKQHDKNWSVALSMEKDRNKYIDEMLVATKERDQYKELLIEACELITNDSYHRKSYVSEFLNKPEIKQLTSEVDSE